MTSASPSSRPGDRPPAFPSGPPSWPRLDERIRSSLEAAYRDGSWGRYHGPHCERLAAKLSELHGVPHVLLCCSGTMAVELALRALKVGPGDEVILAAYDFPGNFRAVEAIGARPVLVDIDPRTWCLDAGEVEAAIGPHTRALLVSHLHGGTAAMPTLREIADRRGLQIVEDACQAPGALIASRPSGTWGDVGVWSFGGSKLLTAGRGGAIFTPRADVHQRAKIFNDRGNDAFPLSELQAAVLLPQVERLDEDNRQRVRAVQRLLDACRQLPHLQPVADPWPGTIPVHYKLAWLCLESPDTAGGPVHVRDELAARLRAEGVAADAGFRGFTQRSERRCRRVGPLTNATRAATQTLLLHHPILLESDATISLLAETLIRCAAETE